MLPPEIESGDPALALPPASPRWQALVVAGAAALGVAVSAGQAEQMAWYAAELLAWNRRINLTAITDPDEVALKHFVDALAPAALIPVQSRVLDPGCGAGFPGLPLKIVRPDLSLTLIDAVRKKISFVSHVIRGLGLERTVACQARLETLMRQVPRPVFDVVVCRAVGPLCAWVPAVVPLLAPRGVVLAFKGPQVEAEIEALARAPDEPPGVRHVGGRRLRVTVRTYSLPVTDDRRTLVQLEIL